MKETTKKVISEEGGFLNFLKPLMTAGLPLMKNLLIRINNRSFSNRCSHSKENFWVWNYASISNEEIDDIVKKVSQRCSFIDKSC